MRFTSLSTLTNTLFISTVILLSLIPAANAYAVVVFTNPTNGTVYHAGDTIPVKWDPHYDEDISGVTVDLHLVNHVFKTDHGAATVSSFLGGEGNVSIPKNTKPSDQYIIQAVTQEGTFGSNAFTISKHVRNTSGIP